MRTALLALTLFWLACLPAAAWSGPRHTAIAAEAFRQLSPRLKFKVTEILKSHPDYTKWQESFVAEAPNIDLATFVFMKASTGPDEIRRRHNHYDHPHWHYIDYPVKPPSFPMEPVLHGIAQHVLGSSKQSRRLTR